MEKYLNKEFLLSNKDKILKAVAVLAFVIAAIVLFITGTGEKESGEIEITGNEQMVSSESELAEEMIMIDISGAVNEPKVVELPVDSRVTDAISAAGGLNENADTSQINQAAFLYDGEKIYIPAVGEDVSGIAVNSVSTGVSAKVDLNTATSEELQTLNGVGPATADKILKYRDDVGYFRSVEDIKKVDGIGEKTYENLKEYIKV